MTRKQLFVATLLIIVLGATGEGAVQECDSTIDAVPGECGPAVFSGSVPPASACDADCYPSSTCGPQCTELAWSDANCLWEDETQLLCTTWRAKMPKRFCLACTCEVQGPEIWRCIAQGTGYRNGSVCVQMCSN